MNTNKHFVSNFVSFVRKEGRMKKLAPYIIPNLGTLIILGLFFAVSATGAMPLQSPAAAPSTTMISYQGQLTDPDGTPLTGTYDMYFALYAVPTGGTACWAENRTGANAVPVSDGLFNVLLGSVSVEAIDPCLTGDVYLGITVGSDSEMTPRELLASVPHALQASTVPDGSITTAKIADGAVTQAKAPTLLKVDSWLPNNGENWRVAAGTAIISVPAGSGHYTVGYVEHSPAFTVPPALFCSIGVAPTGPTEVICELYSNPSGPEGHAVIVLRTVDRSFGLAQGDYEVHWLAIGY
jgi:hypothetical protein